MFALIIGVTLGGIISSLCTAGKITDLEVENYYLLRRLEEQEERKKCIQPCSQRNL